MHAQGTSTRPLGDPADPAQAGLSLTTSIFRDDWERHMTPEAPPPLDATTETVRPADPSEQPRTPIHQCQHFLHGRRSKAESQVRRLHAWQHQNLTKAQSTS